MWLNITDIFVLNHYFFAHIFSILFKVTSSMPGSFKFRLHYNNLCQFISIICRLQKQFAAKYIVGKLKKRKTKLFFKERTVHLVHKIQGSETSKVDITYRNITFNVFITNECFYTNFFKSRSQDLDILNRPLTLIIF